MIITHKPDRRKPVQRAEFETNDGHRAAVYNVTVAKWQPLAAFIVALFVIAGTVFGSVRLGIQVEVQREVDRQLSEPYSPINRRIASLIAAETSRVGDIDNPSDVLIAEQIATLKANQLTIQADLQELRADVKELLRRVR